MKPFSEMLKSQLRLSSPSFHCFWPFSRENDEFWLDFFFHDGAGRIVYMWVLGQRRALRVSPAET